ncbi:MAG: ComEC/Rec2 family competence protein [Phreatobacter sp.]|uniref:ComEC/Rec2 family competence protein n=1 Tax=Phreatobacter sp. TaxID=1966341 RepID=UPI0027328D70|nr:ComEC/Rec2 family competence protein [Phreatobacter sp.]MDP2801091.1 ComEC/Rec2 family competence protein [Phreatobacter sp.]
MAAAVAGRAWPLAGVWPGLTLDVWKGRLRAWGALELERGRAFLMLPVAMGAGILLYFAAPDEPALAAPLTLLAALCLVAFRLRQRYAAFLVVSALAAMAAGFSSATLKTHWMKHPVLAAETGVVRIEAWVEALEKREAGDRLTLHVTAVSPAPDRMPQRIRVTSRMRTAVAVGQPVTLMARLRPPADPAAPGHYDFGRDAYFMGLGASGFVIGAVTVGAASATGNPPWPVRLRAGLDTVRSAISTRIRAAIPGPAGAIADALVTGKRDGIPEGINEAMRAAGTYHILSISGFHMALVAALIFAVVRGGLALVPALALTRHVKAWAALVALLVSTAYLVISGAEVATQRSWIMIAVVLLGVALDRGALTLRTLALAAVAVLVIAPESLLGPSFQMSFAATLALIAGYVTLRPWAERQSGDPAGWGRSVLIVTNGVIGLASSSFVASLATTPYAAFHFNTVHLYGVAGNLLGAPIIEFFVMPLQILALLLWPFGWDKPIWALAGLGIDLFVRSGEWVASWPGGRIIVASLHPTGLLTLSAGFIILGLFSTPLRWLGVPVVVLGLLIAPNGQRPLLLIDGEGATVAARGPDGRLRVVSARGNRFAVQRWLIGEADRRSASDETLQEGVRCDPLGCAMPLAGGGRIAVPRHPDALSDDCREARIVVTRNDPPAGCAAIVVDLRAVAWTGALRIHDEPAGWRVETARPAGADRPWFRPRPTGEVPPVLKIPGRAEPAVPAGNDPEAETIPDLDESVPEPAQ